MKNLEEKFWKANGDLERALNLPAEEQFKLGLKYFRKGPNQNFHVAFELFSMAAEREFPQAMVYVARMYYEGIHVKKSVSKSIKFLKKASSLDSIYAKCLLGGIAKNGDSTELPPETAVSFYTEAADLGSLYAKFCLADIYKNGIGVAKDHAKAIEQYSECIKAEPISKNIGILAESYLGLIQCYLEMHYIEEANTVRDAAYYRSSKVYKQQAKYYLEKAEALRELVSARIKESFENNLRVFSSILNEEDVDLSKMSYGEFRKNYYNKHPRIFLPTKKSEHLIYSDGIKGYFFKRDDSEEEFEYSLRTVEEQIKKRKFVLKRIISNLTLSKPDEEITAITQTCLDEIGEDSTKFKQSYKTDYSSCVINLDKYLEEILHYIFVILFQQHKKEIANTQIESSENLIVKLTKKLSLEKLQNFNSLVNGISLNKKTLAFEREKHEELFFSFISKMIEGKTPKSITRRLNNLHQYQEDETLDQDETKIIEEIDMLNTYLDNREKIKVEPAFQLGSLFDLTFIDHSTGDDGLKLPTPNALNAEILSFAEMANPNLSKNEIYLKLHELILKIEYFRVMVRNVASHKSILTQSLIEKGLNLCIVSESSIFNLLDDLFGNYIETQLYLTDFNKFQSKTDEKIKPGDVKSLINSAIEEIDTATI